MTVHFIGAGPGAADLIMVRGRDLIARCPVCLYAGSLVPRDLLARCPPARASSTPRRCRSIKSSSKFIAAHAAGQDVARLHSGDLSIYSALAEQTRRLARRGIPYTITPGVPAFAAASAALGRELTVARSRAERRAHARARPRLTHAGTRAPCRVCGDGRNARDPSRSAHRSSRRRRSCATLLRRLSGRSWWRARAGRMSRSCSVRSPISPAKLGSAY